MQVLVLAVVVAIALVLFWCILASEIKKQLRTWT